MTHLINFTCSPEEAQDHNFLEQRIRQELHVNTSQKLDFRWRKRSIDARQKQIKINASFEVALDAELAARFALQNFEKLPSNAAVVHIIGAGPAGLFAALEAIVRGIKPILFERGKDIRSRRRDLAQLTKIKHSTLNPTIVLEKVAPEPILTVNSTPAPKNAAMFKKYSNGWCNSEPKKTS